MLKNIEDKIEEQLKMIETTESKQVTIKSVVFLMMNCLEQQKIFSTYVVIKEEVLTTNGLALRELKTWYLVLETIDL